MKPYHKRRFKLKVTKLRMKPTDRDFMANAYVHIKQMNELAGSAPADLREILTAEVRDLRMKVTYNYAQSFYKAELALGPHKEIQIFTHYPETSNLKVMKDTLLKRISKGRQEGRLRNKLTKEFQGMRYQMVTPPPPKGMVVENGVILDAKTYRPAEIKPPKIMPNLKGGGSVFETEKSIIKMLQGDEYRNRIRKAKKPYDKSNFVGVEMELVTKVPREELDRLFIEAKLAGSVYVKTDGSIRTEKTGEIAHEITLIAKEHNILEVIRRVCAVVNTKAVGGYVNNTCGLHVHLDMRNREPEVCYHNFYQSLDVLGRMVPPDRVDTEHGKRYCSLTCSKTFKGALEEGVRYKALNACSYSSHKTIEIRLHSGSTNAEKINNWVSILMAVVNKKDAVANGSVTNPYGMQQAFGLSDAIVEYMLARTKKFENRSLDTRQDHFDGAVA